MPQMLPHGLTILKYKHILYLKNYNYIDWHRKPPTKVIFFLADSQPLNSWRHDSYTEKGEK